MHASRLASKAGRRAEQDAAMTRLKRRSRLTVELLVHGGRTVLHFVQIVDRAAHLMHLVLAPEFSTANLAMALHDSISPHANTLHGHTLFLHAALGPPAQQTKDASHARHGPPTPARSMAARPRTRIPIAQPPNPPAPWTLIPAGRRRLRTCIQVLQHELMARKGAPALEQRTLPLLLGRHAGLHVALDGSPDDKGVQGAIAA
ncbi:hypothetical protein CDD82_7975 [Ophiocordyceps australis]|uniref:Uncharacterized protein n=1 Tax=Ophiocordyceps australis TaxID=1399860 RepID=A0A2C5YN35_9HYPO|nr:hypothetical protein CDD82_7975 [Ophiocordyceps australis]